MDLSSSNDTAKVDQQGSDAATASSVAVLMDMTEKQEQTPADIFSGGEVLRRKVPEETRNSMGTGKIQRLPDTAGTTEQKTSRDPDQGKRVVNCRNSSSRGSSI